MCKCYKNINRYSFKKESKSTIRQTILKCSLSIFGILVISACSSLPELPKTKSMSTEATSQQYYYCESCAKATPLTKEVYQPLEPDVPAVKIEPLVMPVVVPVKHAAKKHHKGKHKRKIHHHKTNQCLQWSNKK